MAKTAKVQKYTSVEIESAIKYQTWLVAGGGSETPVLTRSGAWVQLHWQPATGLRAYFVVGQHTSEGFVSALGDQPLTDAEAEGLLNPRGAM